MDDTQIIDLYWDRDQGAITATAGKYGSFLHALSWNILRSHHDAEECVNDTYFRAWNAIPPERPSALRAWLGRITRNLSLDRWKAGRTQSRGAGDAAGGTGRVHPRPSGTGAGGGGAGFGGMCQRVSAGTDGG